MLRDELRESWAFQEILQEGEQKELIKMLLAIVETRFPELLPQAKVLIERVQDQQILERLLIMLSVARSAEEAGQSLSNAADTV